jgi:hypothetical protein
MVIIKNILSFSSWLGFSLLFGYVLNFLVTGKFIGGGGPPIFESIHFIKTIAIVLFSIGICYLFIKKNPIESLVPLSYPSTSSNIQWPWVSISYKKQQLGIAIVLIFAVFFLFVFMYDKILFRDMSSDQKIVENMSAIFAFFGAVVFGIITVKTYSLRKTKTSFYYLLAGFLALLFFVVSQEETGWGAQLFNFETPELFQGNSQGEMNIHNYATYHFEMAYYFSTFVFFIVFPFFYDRHTELARIPVISFFMPSRLMVYVGAMALAYNYDFWENPFFQISFFTTICILIYYWIDNIDKHRGLLTVLILIYVSSQIFFLIFGEQVIRISAFKEYKEFFIPLTFLFYSQEILVRTKLLKSENSVE